MGHTFTPQPGTLHASGLCGYVVKKIVAQYDKQQAEASQSHKIAAPVAYMSQPQLARIVTGCRVTCADLGQLSCGVRGLSKLIARLAYDHYE
jgi:hypothetical protein